MATSGFPYKCILVVGATSGIGEALAATFVREGAHVIVVGRRKENLDAFVQQHGSDKATAWPFDITEKDRIAGWATEVTERFPQLDAIFLNSGVQRGVFMSEPEQVDFSTIELEFETNYFAHLRLIHAFLPFLQRKKDPTAIIITTSVLGLVSRERCPNYCASKAAMHLFLLGFRAQLKDTSSIRVIEILPPAVQTELHDAKHQPDIKDGGSVGMPLDDFTRQTWTALARGDDAILIGANEHGQTVFEAQKNLL